jgi:hypothetical protein
MAAKLCILQLLVAERKLPGWGAGQGACRSYSRRQLLLL